MNGRSLKVVLIAPNRRLAADVRSRLEAEEGFEVVADLESLPRRERASSLLAQYEADCVFVECSDAGAAAAFLNGLNRTRVDIPVIGFSAPQSPEKVLNLLQAGAFDYLESPFGEATFHELMTRLRRRCSRSSALPVVHSGRLIGFASGKPGSGATTLASQTAFALRRLTGKRVVLIDLNLASGTSVLWAGLDRPSSAADALENIEEIESSRDWTGWTFHRNGISILPAPAMPRLKKYSEESIHRLLRSACRQFDYVIVDLPCIVDPLSMCVLPQLDEVVMAATPELSSLHLAQRHLSVLRDAGIPLSNIHLALNRTTRQSLLDVARIEKLMQHNVAWTVPNDYFALTSAGLNALTGTRPLAQAIRRIAADLAGESEKPLRSAAPALELVAVATS